MNLKGSEREPSVAGSPRMRDFLLVSPLRDRAALAAAAASTARAAAAAAAAVEHGAGSLRGTRWFGLR